MEQDVQIRCMKKDIALVESIKDECVSDFEKLIKQECARDLKVRVIIDTNNMLDEKNNNSIGGVVLTCHSGKIVCSNTLENRLNLAFQESLPDIRSGLFPDLKAETVKKAPVKAQQHAH